jgi:hypothetical protein
MNFPILLRDLAAQTGAFAFLGAAAAFAYNAILAI